ncbi:MAG: hypothetical protein PHW08_02650 [Kiritimatiellae bacterium]|nr:hypothetical protein [Kiritimatiellia bacterium]
MRTEIFLIAVLVLAESVFAETGNLLPRQIEVAANLDGTNQVSQLQHLFDAYPAQLSATNAITVFHLGSRLRPPLLLLARNSDTNVASRAIGWLEQIAHPGDLGLFNWNKAWIKKPTKEIADASLDETIEMAMTHIVWEANDLLTEPILKGRRVNGDRSSAIAFFETFAQFNGHDRSYAMYFGRTGKKWRLEYYNLVWIE